MIYWGIDPGPERCGIAMIHNGKPSAMIVPVGNITDPLQPFAFNWSPDGKLCRPDQVIIGLEMPTGMGQIAGGETFETAFVAGQVWAIYGNAANVVRFSRGAIKKHVLGRSNGSDKDVRAAMIQRWGIPGTKNNPGPTYGITDDGWAALAAATCAYDYGMTNERNHR